MKRKIFALVLALTMVFSLALSVSATETETAGTLLLDVGNGKGTVTVDVYLQGGTGITNGSFAVTYDTTVLTLADVQVSDAYAVSSVNTETAGTVSLAWVGSELTAEQTLMLTLKLEVAEGTNQDLTYTAANTGCYTDTDAVSVEDASVTVSFDAPVTTARLEKAIEAAEAVDASRYTEESYAALVEALEAALAVLADADATQEEVNAATKAVNAAIAALERPEGSADTTALEAAIKAAKALDESQYTKATFQAVKKALAEAEAVFADNDATQEEVDAATDALKAAIAALKKTGGTADTGDESNVALWMGILLLSMAATVTAMVLMVRSGKTKQVKRFLSLVIVMAMLVSIAPMQALAIVLGEDNANIKTESFVENLKDLLSGESSIVQGEDKGFLGTIKQLFNVEQDLKLEQNMDTAAVYTQTDLVRVLVELEGACLLEQGYTANQIQAGGEQVTADTLKLETVQNYVAEQIIALAEASGLGAATIRYSYTVAMNGLAISVPYGILSQIRSLEQVKGAYLATSYTAPEGSTSETPVTPNMYATSDTFGSAQTWTDLGYTGQGMVIAVIDTGLDIDHPSFVDAPESARLTLEDIEAVLTELNAYYLYGEKSAVPMTAKDVYHNGKVPFGFNYVDRSVDVTHDYDSQGDHGTHVAGIAAANKLDTTSVVGVAPDAQVVVMKVFGQSQNGASTDDIIAAIEDCYTLGVDVINMSLGAPAGFTEDSSLVKRVYGRVLESDMMLAIAAGNIPSSAVGNNQGSNLNYTSDPDMGIVNSPSTYLGATSVASSENHYVMMPYFSLGEHKIPFVDVTYVNFAALAGTYEYVIVPGVGDVSDYEGLDVAGRVAVVERGIIDFPTKQKNAFDMGAVALVVYDNVEGALVSMYDGGYLPNVFICKADGEKMIAAAQDGKGLMVIHPYGEETPIKNGNGGRMSDFSAWGVTPDLQLAPDVTAPGGNIYSCYTDGQYGSMSGTSMACPHIAGMSALVLQYLHDQYPDRTDAEYHTMVESLVMCTAEPMLDPNGIHYSPRNQGAGYANVYNAVTSPVYLTSYQKATGELTPKASMGDDPERTGVFTFTFDMHNLTDAAQVYVLDSILMTDQYLTLEGFGDAEFFGEEGRYLSGKVTFAFPNSENLNGFDFDGNGASDMADVQYALDAINGLIPVDADMKLDVNGDGAIDTRDAQYLYKMVTGAIEVQTEVTVPANGSVSVEVTITLSEEDMAYMDAHYENGTYVDGFVRAYAETEGAVDLSLPFMGFYGGWDEAPMFDTGWYYEEEEDLEYNRYMHVVFATLGLDGQYGGLGMNPYIEEIYDPEHNVLSPNGDGYYDYVPEIYVSLLRSAEILDFTWTDDATGEQLFYEYYPYARKGYYWTAYGMAMPVVYTDGGLLPFTLYDENGELMVKDLQHLTLTIRGYLDDGELDECPVDEKGWPVPDTSWADDEMQVPVVIDLKAPTMDLDTLQYYTEDGRNFVTFEVEDNYDIAAVVATTVGGGAYDYIPVTTKTPGVYGERATITLDITDFDSSFHIVLCDYGCNETYYELSNVGNTGLAEDEFYGFRRYSTVTTDTSYFTTDALNGWYSFFDADRMLMHTSQSNTGEPTVFAAEYVDGYIFGAQAGVNGYNTLFVMKAGSWDRMDFGSEKAMNLTVYEWPGRSETYFPLKMVALDMAYDYTTGTMYMLANAFENNYFPEGETNILLSLDIHTGELQVLGKIVPEEDENFLALTLACDNEGVLYTANYENSKLYVINKEPVETTERYGYGTYEATCISEGDSKYWVAAYTQSMTVDHATNTLYWAAYQGQTGVSAFLKMDKTTGQIVSMTYTADNAEMVGLFKPWDSGKDIIPDSVLTGIGLRETELYLSVGQNKTLIVKPEPYSATLGEITYTSLNEDVATVTSYGIVEAKGIGAAEILVTCEMEDGTIFQQTCVVNVSNVSGTLFGYSDPYWMLMDSGKPGQASQVVDAMELEGEVSAAAYRDGYLYVATLLESYDADNNKVYTTNLYKLDVNTLQGELVGSFDGKTTALAFNYADGFMYGLRYTEKFDARWNQTITYELFRLNTRTAEAMVVTNLNSIYPYSERKGQYQICSGALAIDYEGNFYVNGDNADGDYNLVRFNLDEEGRIVNVKEYVGFSAYHWNGDSMVWSQRNGGLLHVAGDMLQWVDVSNMDNVVAVNLGKVRGANAAVLALAVPITNEPTVQGVAPEGVSLDAVYTVPEGETVKVSPTLNPWNAVGEFEFFIADESIAKVDENGVVTGMAIGETTLTVRVVGTELTASATIVVEENPGYLFGYLQGNLEQQIPLESWGKIPLADPYNFNFISDMYDLTIYSGAFYDNTIYAFGQHNSDGKYYMMRISSSNFFYNIIRESEIMIRDMAFDYTTGTMYAVAYNETIQGGLYQVDLNTLELVLVADNDKGAQLVTLACDDEGILYAADDNGEVFTVDKDDAELHPTGIFGRTSIYLQSMTYDYNNDVIYWAVGGSIYELDTENLRTVHVGTTDCSISSLFSVPHVNVDVPETVDPAGVVMAEKNTVAVGDKLAIEAVVLPVSVATVDQTLFWTSSDETIAIVDENGVITGVAAGEVYITATDAKGNSDTILITVTAERRFFYGYDELGKAWVKFGSDGVVLETWKDAKDLSPIVAAQYIDGVLYAYDRDGFFYTVDTQTFQRTLMGNGINGVTTSLEAWDKTHDGQVYFIDDVPYRMIDLTYNTVEGTTTLYGVMMAWNISLWRDSFSYKIVQLDMQTGAITDVIVEDALVDGMSLRPTNLLYRGDTLWTINGYITGLVTAIDPVSGSVGGIAICPEYWGDFNGGRSMIEDPLTGQVYAIRDKRTDYIGSADYTDTYATSILCTIDLSLGKVDPVCTVGSNLRLVGLFIK